MTNLRRLWRARPRWWVAFWAILALVVAVVLTLLR